MSSEERHMCHCGKGFLRKEHLRRHQATHAQPSFVCHICDRSFTRNDVLKRHIAVHETAQVSTARTWRACDACHENKTKCDGGEQCALCTKRGIACTYRRDGSSADSMSDEKGERGARDLAPTDIEKPTQEDQVMGSPTPAAAGISKPEDPPQDPVELARAGLECISNAVATTMAGGKKHKASPTGSQSWISKCVRTYFRDFHERWPIVHGPIFEEKTDGTLIVSTVVMIGSWHGDDASVRESIFKLHERFMFYLLRKMISGEGGPDQPWPYETYQISLLHIVLAFESGKPSLLPGARRLLLLLITSLRSNGSFNADMIERHECTHSPGTFRPWLFGHRTRWRRLAVLTMKIDTYLGLTCNQPSTLQAEELELGLPSTFTLWHSYGIDKFFARQPQEPPWRDQTSMAAFLGGSIPVSGLLVEDVALGLCATYPNIWKWSQTSRGNIVFQNSVPTIDGSAVDQQLESWKARLDNISNLWTEPELKAEDINFLLRAYRGGEEEGDAVRWESPVLTRIAVFCLNTTMLYNLLAVHLGADVKSLSTLTLGSWSLAGGPPVASVPEGPTLGQWALEPRARSSVIHSIFILKAYENALATMEDVCKAMDPIAQVALCTGAVVMRGWFGISSCNCHAGGVQSLDINDTSEKDRWVQLNGSVTVDGVALCRCSSGPWMARFVSALTQGGQLWDMSGSVAECLRKPMDGL